MLKFLVFIVTIIMFPIAVLYVGFDIGKSFIEFHMTALFKD